MFTPEARICYERAESLCQSLNRPALLYSALMGQWTCSLVTDKLTTTLQIAQRLYSLAQQRNDPWIKLGAWNALAATHYWLGNFESARRYAMPAVRVWRSGGVQSHATDLDLVIIGCFCYEAMCEWHLGELGSYKKTMEEAIVLARELNSMAALGLALYWAGSLAHFEGNPAEVERLASELIELSTRQGFINWLPGGVVLRGWAHSVSGHTAEGIGCIDDGIRDYEATPVRLPYFLSLKAEALYRADRSVEALETIREAQVAAERSEARWWCAELHRLHGVLLAALGADQAQIEASFKAAISTAREQKSVSLEKRAAATYSEYRRRNALGEHAFRLPLS
jgi:hypothetical protein